MQPPPRHVPRCSKTQSPFAQIENTPEDTQQAAKELQKPVADAAKNPQHREVIVAEAYRDSQKVKGEGDAKASALYAESFGRDPQFAQFYRSLEAYKSSFNSKSDVMVLDPGSSEFFKGMRGSSGNTPARK